jgi:hypothetical protein
MFKKFKSWVLMIILAVLMVIYLLVRYSGNNERTFRDKVLEIDAAAVTEILVSDPKSKEGTVDLKLSGNKWTVSNGGREYTADTNVVKGMLKQIGNMPTKRYAGKGKDVCAKYELTDSAATLITLKNGNKTIGELYIGKFAYNVPKDQQQQMQAQGRQQRGDMTTYVRLADEKDVYAVDGFLKMGFSGNISSYRVRSLTGINPSDINKITVDEPGISKVFENVNGKWLLNGTPTDSAKAARFSSVLARLTANKFVDQQAPTSGSGYSVKIEGNNFTPIEIEAFPVADTNLAYVVTSSANPEAYFNGKEGGLFKKIWQYY